MVRLLICVLIWALPAVAQLDSPALRAKFGAPLNRETFHLPAGFDLVVDYGPDLQVCKLEVPSLMPTDENPANLVVMKQRMYAFLADLVPDAMRGKELMRGAQAMGAISIQFTEYEHVMVTELLTANEQFAQNPITVTFKRSGCAKQPNP